LDAIDGAAAIANAIATITAATAISTIRCLNAPPSAAKFVVVSCCPIVFLLRVEERERDFAALRFVLHPDLDGVWGKQHRAKDRFVRGL